MFRRCFTNFQSILCTGDTCIYYFLHTLYIYICLVSRLFCNSYWKIFLQKWKKLKRWVKICRSRKVCTCVCDPLIIHGKLWLCEWVEFIEVFCASIVLAWDLHFSSLSKMLRSYTARRRWESSKIEFEILVLFQSRPFHAPVSARTVPDYYKIVKNPMDLQTIKEVSLLSPVHLNSFLKTGFCEVRGGGMASPHVCSSRVFRLCVVLKLTS